jgi:hypothetical protein
MKASIGMTLVANAIAVFATAAYCAPVHDNDPDLIEIRQYRLTMDKLDKAATASQQMNAMMASNPDFKKRADAEDNDATIDQKARRFDTTFPEAAAIVRRNGLSTREYIVVSLAFMNDFIMVGMKMQGTIKTYPPNSVTPENAAFVEQNFEKLKTMADKMTPAESADNN